MGHRENISPGSSNLLLRIYSQREDVRINNPPAP
jgi:hypothetical protein